MRIDLPQCGFHYCRFQFDGNCTSTGKYEKCEYRYLSEQIEPGRKKGKWIPIWEDDPNTFPPVDKEGYSDYVLLSFSNYSGLIIGQYRVDEDGGAFYAGDDEEPLTVHDLYVNAWQPLPSPYQEEGEEE